MNRKWSSGSNSIDNMDGIVYNDRQMKDFLKSLSLIHSLDVLKIGWLNLKMNSLNK